MKKKVVFIVILLLIIAFAFYAYWHYRQKEESKQKAQEAVKTVVAKSEVPVIPIYYKGTMQPKEEKSITSPVDGRISRMYFNYGDHISKKQKLIELDSTTLNEDYHKSITDYLSAKNSYYTGIEEYKGSMELYKAGANSKSQFESDKTTHDTAFLTYVQAKLDLEAQFDLYKISNRSSILSLKYDDVGEIKDILQSNLKPILVTSDQNGIALYPSESSASSTPSDESSGPLSVGTELKKGQLLLSVGDLSGYSVSFDVSEIDVNSLKVGMPVTVTGDAFSDITLQGKIDSISSQAKSGSGSGTLSQFTVSVLVPSLPAKADDVIKVGMTCKVEIKTTQPKGIMLPVSAVAHNDTGDFVMMMGDNGVRKPVVVTTGITTPTGVVIKTGVKEGDRVVIDNKT